MKDGILPQILTVPPGREPHPPNDAKPHTPLVSEVAVVPFLLCQPTMSRGGAAASAWAHRDDFSKELTHHVPVA